MLHILLDHQLCGTRGYIPDISPRDYVGFAESRVVFKILSVSPKLLAKSNQDRQWHAESHILPAWAVACRETYICCMGYVKISEEKVMLVDEPGYSVNQGMLIKTKIS